MNTVTQHNFLGQKHINNIKKHINQKYNKKRKVYLFSIKTLMFSFVDTKRHINFSNFFFL